MFVCAFLILFWERCSVAKGHVRESVFLVILCFNAEFTQLECAAHTGRGNSTSFGRYERCYGLGVAIKKKWSGGCHWVPSRSEVRVHEFKV